MMQTEHAIKLVKDTFQQELSSALRLRRVTAPLFVESGHGLNDDLTGVEKPITFFVPELKPFLPDAITFIDSEELLQRYPNLSAKERENAICQQFGAVFIEGIGAPLSNGQPHDSRAADYDDWSLNGDILIWYPILNKAIELSSMGIRVDAQSMKRQLAAAGHSDWSQLDYHKAVLTNTLPLTIGGGIGQSRLCMTLLHKRHIGEVQVSEWSAEELTRCAQNDITLLQ